MTEKELYRLYTDYQTAKSKRLKAQIKAKLDLSVVNYFSDTESGFKTCLLENYGLLTNKAVKFNVYQDGGSMWGTHTKNLEDEMHNNGYIYLHSTKLSSPFRMFASSFYRRRFSGSIHWNGQIHLKLIESDFQFFGSRVPEVFGGSIDNLGNIEIKTIKSYFEIDGHIHMIKMICDPFSGDLAKRKKYMHNLNTLIRSYHKFMDHLKSLTPGEDSI